MTLLRGYFRVRPEAGIYIYNVMGMSRSYDLEGLK
jgi:hypothetical protein